MSRSSLSSFGKFQKSKTDLAKAILRDHIICFLVSIVAANIAFRVNVD